MRRSARRPAIPFAISLAIPLAILCCAAGAVRAGDLVAGDPDCGGDAFSSARVVERRVDRRGPLTAVPQTLCADLAPQHPAQIDILAGPILAPQVGPSSPPTPYDDRPLPVGRPPRLRP